MAKPPKNSTPKSTATRRMASGARSKASRSNAAKPAVLTPEVLEKVVLEEGEQDEDLQDTHEDSDNAADDLVIEAEAHALEENGTETHSVVPHGSAAEALPEKASETGLVQADLLKRYLEEVSRYELLSPEEEFALASRLRESGDLEAARRLVRANLRLVVKIAMEYRSAYQNVLDLIQEGNIGLMKAVSKFDPTKGAKLSYYAGWWIRSYILKYILDNFRLVRVGTTQAQKKLFFHLMREKERLEAQGLAAGPKLLADRLQVREQDVIEMEQRLSGRGAEMSLNHPLDNSEGEARATHLDMLADQATHPDDALASSELQEILKAHLEEFAKTLKEKEFAVFKERLASENPKTLQEVADQFGLTRERARQIEARVIEKLREFYKDYIR